MSKRGTYRGNSELRERLRDLDEDDDVGVTSWEAEFIESILYGHSANRFQLSEKQVETAERILEKYGK